MVGNLMSDGWKFEVEKLDSLNVRWVEIGGFKFVVSLVEI